MTDELRPNDGGEVAGGETATETAVAEEPKKLHQTVEIKDVGPCKKSFKVSVGRDDIEDRLKEKFKELVVDSNVSGFRPGKAPRKVVERRYSKEVGNQVKAEILLASLEQLAEEHDVAPLSPPNIDPLKIEIPKEGPLVYEFEVEVRPHFDLPNYKGMKLRRPVRTFNDEDVAQEKRRLLAPHGKVIPKEGGQVEIGDLITVDVTCNYEGNLVSTLKDLTVRVDPRLAFKDGVAEQFGEKLKGAKAGDQRVVDVAIATSAADDALREKSIQATFAVKEVKSLQLPDLTHEFLHHYGVHSPEQFDELMRVVLQRRLENQQRQSAREQILAQITTASAWELPEELLARQARQALGRKALEMRSEGIAEEEIQGRLRILHQDVLRSTAQSLKEHFVLQKIAEVEKIDVDEDDVTDEIERMAEMSNDSARRIRARLEKEDMMETLAAELVERKALDLILETAEYEDVAVDQKKDSQVATIEEQTVPGEMHDPAAPPPAAEEPAPPTTNS